MAIKWFKHIFELSSILILIFQIHIRVELLSLEFINHLHIDVLILLNFLHFEELLRLYFVGELIDQKDKILLSEVLTVVGEFLEEEFDFLEGVDNFEEVEIFHE